MTPSEQIYLTAFVFMMICLFSLITNTVSVNYRAGASIPWLKAVSIISMVAFWIGFIGWIVGPFVVIFLGR